MKALLIINILFCLAFHSGLLAQQLPRYSQYIMNEFLINPSVAGVDGRTSLDLSARKEWVGFVSNTPETYSFSAQTRILKSRFNIKSGLFGSSIFKGGSKGRVGLGLNLYNDNNAAIHRTGLQLTYAYHIFIQNSQLSFGLTGSIYQFKISREHAILKDPDDRLNALIGKGTIIPDATFGMNYMTQKYHLGFSVAQLFQSSFKLSSNVVFSEAEDIRLRRHYYLIGSFRQRFARKPKWEYEPAFILRTNERFQTLSDISLKFIFNREYWFGFSGRTSGDAIIMLGMKFNNMYFAYSFDYGFNGISRFSKGSHEITLAAKFGDTTRRYRWLERY
ncbi:MAG: type IX secretion system membrane protein PorP/SprF [Bacteroidales bacterium]|nr:type IX secretion system membrane protein PorP/SprF [Bacteroidales bacterium]